MGRAVRELNRGHVSRGMHGAMALPIGLAFLVPALIAALGVGDLTAPG